MKLKRRNGLSNFQLLSLGYLIVILIGAGLLCLPFATRSGEPAPFINALLTSTSTTCVTGLTPYDPGVQWSLFGQIVMLVLIQIGGLGFMTFVSVLFRAFGKNLGMGGKKSLMLSTGGNSFEGIGRMIKRIIIGTVIFELLGAILLSIRFIPMLGTAKGIYFAVWHSVSAFCNAGFDLFGGVVEGYGQFSSLTMFAKDPLVLLTIAFLIIIGGIGFCVWGDILENRFKFKKFQLHTKVMIISTSIIVIVPTFLFLLFERNSASMADMNFGERLLSSFFCAVSPRTAGFAAIDYGNISDSGYLLTIMLMFIGGGSGSTAGGIKLGTFAVILMGIVATVRGKRDITIGNRRLEHSIITQALAIIASCLILVVTSTLIICTIEPDSVIPFKAVLFECFSALGTVGLSIPVTEAAVSTTTMLSVASKVIICLLMYAGRVGILTLALAFGKSRDSAEVKKPLDNLLIG